MRKWSSVHFVNNADFPFESVHFLCTSLGMYGKADFPALDSGDGEQFGWKRVSNGWRTECSVFWSFFDSVQVGTDTEILLAVNRQVS